MARHSYFSSMYTDMLLCTDPDKGSENTLYKWLLRQDLGDCHALLHAEGFTALTDLDEFRQSGDIALAIRAAAPAIRGKFKTTMHVC